LLVFKGTAHSGDAAATIAGAASTAGTFLAIAVGGAIARLAADRSLAQALGDAGFDRASAISWEGVVERLMANG
jgi:hypothetical protein